MALKKNEDLRNAQADFLGSIFDGGTLEIYTGTQPSDPNDAPSGTLLCTITLPNPAFAAATGGAITMTGTWSGTAVDTGVAGWCRFISASTDETMDSTVSELAGGTNVLINDENVVVSNTVEVTNLVLRVPES